MCFVIFSPIVIGEDDEFVETWGKSIYQNNLSTAKEKGFMTSDKKVNESAEEGSWWGEGRREKRGEGRGRQ